MKPHRNSESAAARTVIAVWTLTMILTACLLPTGRAADPVKLGAGSAAPPLRPAVTVKGQLPDLGKGLHVVELWATWCGPCKESIPHLTALAKKFAGKADITGVSIMEEGDATAKVQAFVRQMGDRMDYIVAYDGAAAQVEKDWFNAAGQPGVPTAFVVQDGKLVWTGHPLALEPVLSDVVAGTFDPARQREREEKMAEELDTRGALLEAVQDAAGAGDGPTLKAAVARLLAADPAREPELTRYRFEALALTDGLPAALAYLKQWASGPGFDQEPLTAYEAWLVVMTRSLKPSKEEWAFLAGLLDRCNARVQPVNPLTASAEATALARSGDPARAAEWERKALELASHWKEDNHGWVAKHQKTLAEYQTQAGQEVSLPPAPSKRPSADQEDEEEQPEKDDADEPPPGAKLVGHPAPDFTLPDLDGKPVALAGQKGSVVVLDFWATWCGPCVESLPGLETLAHELEGRGLKVFAVNNAEEVKPIRAFLAKRKLALPVLRDADQAVLNRYLVNSIPHTVVIGRDGNVRAVFVGGGNEEKIRAAALAALGLRERFALASKLPLVDDGAVIDRLAGSARKLADADKLVDGEALGHSLDAAARQPVAATGAQVVPALPADRPATAAADLYARARPGVLVLAGVRDDGGRKGGVNFTATGFVVTASGVAVTNYHVIEEIRDDASLLAQTADGRVVPVRAVLAADRVADIAVIQLDGDGFTPLPLAEGAPVGAPVAVISHPDNHFFTFTRGVVSRYCLQRFSEDDPYPTPVVEITADYARGSSGGPLLDAEGRVVGMVCSTKSVYLHQDGERSVGLQMVFKASIPSELIIALLRGQPLKTLDGPAK